MTKENIKFNCLNDLMTFIKSKNINRVSVKTKGFIYHSTKNDFIESLEYNIIFDNNNSSSQIINFKIDYNNYQNIVIAWV